MNHLEYFYKYIFGLEKEALDTVPMKLKYGWKVLTLNTKTHDLRGEKNVMMKKKLGGS